MNAPGRIPQNPGRIGPTTPSVGKTGPRAPSSTPPSSPTESKARTGPTDMPAHLAMRRASTTSPSEKQQKAAAETPPKPMTHHMDSNQWLASMAHLPIKDDAPAKLEGEHAQVKDYTLAEEHTEADKPKRSIGEKVLDTASAINPVIGRVRTAVKHAQENGENVFTAGAKEYGKTLVDMGMGAVSAVTTLASSGVGLTAEANPIGLVAVAATGAYLKASGKNEYAPGIIETASKFV